MSDEQPIPKPEETNNSLQEAKEHEHHLDAMIPEEVVEMLQGMPEPQQKAVKAILVGISYQRLWQGPLPPPEILKRYNDAFPNGAERIFLEAQKQTNHRLELEKTVIPGELKQSGRGQIFGFIIALAFLIASFILILMGFGIYGTIIGSIDLVALVTVFVLGRKAQQKQLADK